MCPLQRCGLGESNHSIVFGAKFILLKGNAHQKVRGQHIAGDKY